MFKPRKLAARLDGIGLSGDRKLKHMELYGRKEQIDAGFKGELESALQPDPEFFSKIPAPREGDWLYGRPGGDQSFRTFVRCGGRRPMARAKIYLLPVRMGKKAGDADDELLAVLSEPLRAVVESFFCLPTVLLDAVPMSKLGKVETRMDEEEGVGWKQFRASSILDGLKKLRPRDSHTLCAFTMCDLYNPSYNYLFGLAGLDSGVGVFSFHRHDPASPSCEFWKGSFERDADDFSPLLRRATATLLHEIGHTFGIRHCTYFQCLMMGSNSLAESESRGLELCPACLRKLMWALGKSPLEHYQNLLRHYQSSRFREAYEEPRNWIERRLEKLGGRDGRAAAVDDQRVGAKEVTVVGSRVERAAAVTADAVVRRAEASTASARVDGATMGEVVEFVPHPPEQSMSKGRVTTRGSVTTTTTSPGCRRLTVPLARRDGTIVTQEPESHPLSCVHCGLGWTGEEVCPGCGAHFQAREGAAHGTGSAAALALIGVGRSRRHAPSTSALALGSQARS